MGQSLGNTATSVEEKAREGRRRRKTALESFLSSRAKPKMKIVDCEEHSIQRKR